MSKKSPQGDQASGGAGGGSRRSRRIAEHALEDRFTFQGVTAYQPRASDGGYDWRWEGPRKDPEWAWFFNRHAWLCDLWTEWERTSEERFRDAVFEVLRDWITANPPPKRFNFSAAWRPLEVARRLTGTWLPLWEAWMGCASLPDDLRAALVESLRAQGEHLRRHHAWGGNHLVTEMLALFSLSRRLNHEEWRGYSLAKLCSCYQKQVYPDGSHKELSSHYQKIITLNYTKLADMLEADGREEAVKWRACVVALWLYIRAVTTPSGFNPLNNDSDQEPFSKILKRHAPKAVREDELPPVSHFPWAGHTVFRGHDHDDYTFVDTGPRGTDHDHADLLSLCLSVGKADFLTDNGRYTYKPGAWRDYFSGPRAHNLVMLDGVASDQGPRQWRSPPKLCPVLEDGELCSVAGSAYFLSRSGARMGDWRRTVYYVCDRGWVVVDQLLCFRTTVVDTLWHWDPRCKVENLDALRRGQTFLVRNGACELVISLVSNQPEVQGLMTRGRVAPTPLGWHSERFNERIPAPTTLFSQPAGGVLLNAWVFSPVGRESFSVHVNEEENGIRLAL